MTSTPSPAEGFPPRDDQRLNEAVEVARQAHAAQAACIWARLVQELASDESTLSAALLRQHGIAVMLGTALPAGAHVRRVGGAGANLYRVETDQGVLLAGPDPWSTASQAALMRQQGAAVRLALADAACLALLAQRAAQATTNGAPALTAQASSGAAGADSPVVRFVDQAIAHGHAEGASDIHFESDRRGVGVKYRLDGVMLPGPHLDDAQRAEEVISRIKVMAQLDITERRRPQDGRIRWSAPVSASDAIDMRVSVMPSIFGEDAVLRLLDKSQLRQGQDEISLDTLGFKGEAARTMRQLAMRPHGMLLVTGPTGSGKTTTVYGALSEVNDGLGKIITIEDPVEYELPGVLQIPVNEQKGLTFATGLRSILRHDPDKILVGEIRDGETARIAVQSALTGHLVFTTVHANSLLDVLGRFEHFDIDPFSLASALNGVVVQRLLRRLCTHCLRLDDPSQDDRKVLGALSIELPARVPVACGCDLCRHSGYRGRMVVAEVHSLDDRVRDLMVRRSSIAELRAAMRGAAARPLLHQAMDEVKAGVTSLEEVRRVVGWA